MDITNKQEDEDEDEDTSTSRAVLRTPLFQASLFHSCIRVSGEYVVRAHLDVREGGREGEGGRGMKYLYSHSSQRAGKQRGQTTLLDSWNRFR